MSASLVTIWPSVTSVVRIRDLTLLLGFRSSAFADSNLSFGITVNAISSALGLVFSMTGFAVTPSSDFGISVVAKLFTDGSGSKETDWGSRLFPSPEKFCQKIRQDIF